MCVLVGMDARQLRTEFREGRISGKDLINHCEQQQATIRKLHRDKDRLRERLARYEPEVRAEVMAASSRDPRPAAAYCRPVDRVRNRSPSDFDAPTMGPRGLPSLGSCSRCRAELSEIDELMVSAGDMILWHFCGGSVVYQSNSIDNS
jgi:hypothetical protein